GSWSKNAASEGLPDTGINGVVGIPCPLVERHCNIEANGTEARVIAHADTRAEAEVFYAREVVGSDIAAVDKANHADLFSYFGSSLERCFEEVAATGYDTRAVVNADGLEAIAADRTAAAGKEELVERGLIQRGPHHSARLHAASQNIGIVFAKAEIG